MFSYLSFLPSRICFLFTQNIFLNSQTKDGGDYIHRLVLPPHSARSVRAVVPVARRCCMEASASLLQNYYRDNVFKWLPKSGQPLQTLLYDVGRPLAHLLVLVCVDADGCLDRLQ